MEGSPDTWFWWGLVAIWSWLALVIAASVFYRRSRGKSVWYRDDPNALFVEKRASGHSHRTWYTKLGGAQNALAVVVTPEHLVVRPLFPFNLMFLPEIYGLENTVPFNRLRGVELTRRFGKDGVDVEFEDASGSRERLSLWLRRRDEFVEALGHASHAASPRQP